LIINGTVWTWNEQKELLEKRENIGLQQVPKNGKAYNTKVWITIIIEGPGEKMVHDFWLRNIVVEK